MLLALCGRATAETVPLPSGAITGTARSTALESTSCPAAGDCVAVGNYRDSGNTPQGLIETESGGIWTAIEAPTTGLGSSTSWLSAVSCQSAGNCVAIGGYDNAAHVQLALIETETNGLWSGSQLSLTGIGYNGYEFDMNALSCTASGSCVAVGTYSTASAQEAFVATESSGVWTPSQVNVSALGVGPDPSAELTSVACAAAGSCAAVGTFVDSSNHDQGLIDTESGGAWTASKPNMSSLPSVATNPYIQLNSVSCPAAGDCTAVGRYSDATGTEGSYEGLAVSSTNAAWAAAAKFALPADANFTNPGHIAQPGLNIDSVSCGSVGNCMAVGNYSATPANTQDALQLSEANGVWATGVAATPPTAVYTPSPSEQLNSVVCLAGGPCTALGIYTDANGLTDAWVTSQRGSSPSAASVPLTTAESDGQATLACSTSDYCAAGGYAQYSSTDYPFLLDPPAAPTGQSAAIAGTEGQVAWTPPADTGGLPITGYTTIANDTTDASRGGETQATGTSGAPVFTGLTPGDNYAFTITPMSALGNGIPATTASFWVPWTNAQLLASLSGLLAPRGTPSHLKKLRRSHGYSFTYTPLESGTVSIRWFHTSGRGKHRRQRLVGSGSVATNGTTPVKVHVSLTGLGRRLVRLDHRLRLTAKVTFVTDAKTTLTRTRTFTLH